MASPFRLYNTLSRGVEDFQPIEEGKVRLYVCGMTVYDDCHVGHARAMVTFDTISHYLRHRGWDVTFVRNFTDVDDKIIARANAKGEEPLAFAEHFISRFHDDMEALGLRLPDHEPRVSTSMPTILEVIGKLVERGHAYASEGSVWFDVRSFEQYGKLSGRSPDDMREGNKEAQPGKRSPLDFGLWKAVKPGEPSWESPWGPGRPGWHIECSAMAYETLGATIDIHGGGLDLVFPHHENEVAQSECAHGAAPYARYWMHNGMLTMASGQKMGKSLGNVFGIREAVDLFGAEALRIYYMQVHYRSPLPWSIDGALPDALALLARLYEAMETARTMKGEEDAAKVAKEMGPDAQRALELADGFEARFYAAMDDDFNTAKALGYAFELARAFNRFANLKKAKKRGGPIAARTLAAFAVVKEALGLLAMEPEAFIDEVKAKRLPQLGVTKSEVEEKLAARSQARVDKDWARADSLRAELEEAGIQVMDRPDRVDWRVRLDTTQAK